MTKAELLAHARAHYYTNKTAVRMAELGLSEADAQQRAFVLGRRIKGVHKVLKWLYGLTFLLILALFFGARHGKWTTESVEANVMAIVAGLFCAVVAQIPVAILHAALLEWWANREEKRMLEPIAGTGQCAFALQSLEDGGDMVRHWRDIAVAERGQLHGFDRYVMEGLRFRHQDIVAEAKYFASDAEACRKVHGLGDPEPLELKATEALIS